MKGTHICFSLRHPAVSDGSRIIRLVRNCAPLDVNSEYLYCLIGYDFSLTSVVAERASNIIGFVSGYFRPREVNCLFIWQVAVHPDFRGQGVAISMLEWLAERNPFDSLVTTISPSNVASKSLFQSFAQKRNLSLTQHPFLDSYTEETGLEHEREDLFRLFPNT